MKIVIYGLTITSSWGNGHATTYRALCKALAQRGHRIDFVERDVEWYRSNRDLPSPDYAKIHLYDEWSTSYRNLLGLSADADAAIVGSYFPDATAATDALFEAGRAPVYFYDIDTPITMGKLRASGSAEYLEARHIPHFAAYLSFTGGPVLRELMLRFGSPCAVPFYCSVDPDIYQPAELRPEFACALSYLGTFAADRQTKLMQLLNGSAALLPEAQFIVAGSQYPANTNWLPNVRRFIHLSPADHPAFYSSGRFTLNLTRSDMVAAGYSPSVRLFEASACGAVILSDHWTGLEEFLTPGEEILLPADAYEVASIVSSMHDAERQTIGRRARERILAQHTSQHRALELEAILARSGGTLAASYCGGSSSSKEEMQ